MYNIVIVNKKEKVTIQNDVKRKVEELLMIRHKPHEEIFLN